MLDLRVGGVHPDIMILLPIVAGIAGGPGPGGDDGVRGRPGGRPVPAHALRVVGAGREPDRVRGGSGHPGPRPQSALWLPPVAALVGSAAYEIVYAVLGSVLGQPQMLHVDLLRIMVVVSVTNAVLAIPALRLVTWALAGGVDRGGAHLGPLLGRVR